ncbi:hypothetical protein [Paenibacillus sp. UMB4589-SE434]|uniref:hypothetical protein n=1 Tax=Paenibacillus sp. UMB4589-SE434 TaxID=3046314 RepID=UPI0025518898|nr:hypothetical protein [Paenibacillus sp. UMB4589-SE434]MDK8182112.1 hypothetical protein [Paenibacillus sp. UMB4589-SE434]
MNLIDAVYATLRSDQKILQMLGLPIAPTQEELAKRIVRGMEPDHTITADTIPMILAYIKPGRFTRNHLVYEGKFCLEFLSHTTKQTREMADRAFDLFHDKSIQLQGFRTFCCELAFDTHFATGITGVKGYSAVYDVDYLRMN